MNEIIFEVEDAPEGGYTARALGASIYTEAGSFAELREAVRCHFEDGQAPTIVHAAHGDIGEKG